MTGVPAGGGFPAEATCQSCHESLPLNPEPPAILALTGLPEQYVPGERYQLALQVSHSADDRQRWGFQITAIDLGSYTRSGRFEITNPDETQIVPGGFGEREYVEHAYRGTGIGQRESMRWEFAWVAPPEAGREIGFFAAVNVSNADGAKEGDWIYTPSPLPLATLSAAPSASRK